MSVHTEQSSMNKQAVELVGARLSGANGEKLGKVAEVLYHPETGAILYVVVESGTWIRSSRFLIPSNRLDGFARIQELSVNIAKADLSQFPPFNDELRDLLMAPRH